MVDSAEAFDVTSWTSDAIESTRSIWVCAERTAAEASASSGTAWSVTSATSLVVALSVWASLASATARKETRIAQKTATRIPATSPPDTVCTRSLKHACMTKSRTASLSRRGWSSVPDYRPHVAASRAERSYGTNAAEYAPRPARDVTATATRRRAGRRPDMREPAASPAREGEETAGRDAGGATSAAG